MTTVLHAKLSDPNSLTETDRIERWLRDAEADQRVRWCPSTGGDGSARWWAELSGDRLPKPEVTGNELKCSACKHWYPPTRGYWYVKRTETHRGGMDTMCIDCRRASNRKYRLAHLEERRAAGRRSHAQHPEAYRAATYRHRDKQNALKRGEVPA